MGKGGGCLAESADRLGRLTKVRLQPTFPLAGMLTCGPSFLWYVAWHLAILVSSSSGPFGSCDDKCRCSDWSEVQTLDHALPLIFKFDLNSPTHNFKPAYVDLVILCQHLFPVMHGFGAGFDSQNRSKQTINNGFPATYRQCCLNHTRTNYLLMFSNVITRIVNPQQWRQKMSQVFFTSQLNSQVHRISLQHFTQEYSRGVIYSSAGKAAVKE